MALEIYTWVNKKVTQMVKNHLGNRTCWSSYQDDSSHIRFYNRYIQVETSFPNMSTIHYEYICGRWELHFEPENDEDTVPYQYARIIRYVRELVPDSYEIRWVNHGSRTLAIYNVEVHNEHQLEEGLRFLYKTFDEILSTCAIKFRPLDMSAPYALDTELNKQLDIQEEVSLVSMKIPEIFSYNLVIPDYQRIYCWSDKNIQTLWKDLCSMPDNQDYHLGSIILQNKKGSCDVIDGQQRLVTLTLILRALGYQGTMPLLLQRFKSIEACNNIANAKFVINNLKGFNYEDKDSLLRKITNHLVLSVLVLNSENLDLAYTFFSNQNSKGVRLSDYDILKAHHLRYLIANEKQSEHLARRWNALSLECDSSNESIVHTTLGLHLFRLRKWMRKNSCDDESSSRPVKDEYSAAELIPGIPPFGEKFYFYEKIQGGSHFFAFTDVFVDLYKQFVTLPQVRLLRKHLLGESHWKYESVIESVLFAYYSKFGRLYLSEALFCIVGVIAQHRYGGARALQYKINKHVQDSELVMMIDQATSPSFFLAESIQLISLSGKDLGGGDIRVRFYYCLKKIFNNLQDPHYFSDTNDARVAMFSDVFIESKVKQEYD